MERTGSAERVIAASPEEVFAAITDVRALPEWNQHIVAVVADAELAAGAQWVVRMRYPGKTFDSRSTVLEFDRNKRRIRYASKPTDDNPSTTEWTWEVGDHADGSVVRLSWQLKPVTFIRRRVIAPMRSRQIPREAAASLVQLERRLHANPVV